MDDDDDNLSAFLFGQGDNALLAGWIILLTQLNFTVVERKLNKV